jgi:hypothetical protein
MRSSKTLLIATAGFVAALFLTPPAVAQDIDTCDTVKRYVDREDYPRALEELSWCQRAIQELHYEKIGSILERDVAGFSAGEASYEAALGFSSVEIEYRGDAGRVELQVTSGAGGAVAAAKGLGALASMASAFGLSSNDMKQVRVAGITGTLDESDDDKVELILTMDGGIILTWSGPDLDAIKAIAEEIIPDLEDYLD